MTPIVKPPPELRGGNLSAYMDRSPEVLNHGKAGSGKSVQSLFRLVHMAMIFPKTRWFLVRKTKASLVESALVTLERDVFGEDSPILLNRPMMRKTRDYYTFPNGSVIVTAGMDKPEKLFSTEYNGGYVQEATELEQDEWQSLKRSLRAPFTSAIKIKDGPTPVPFYSLWGDCNPSYSHHWLKKRMDSKVTSGHFSTHEDNPRFYDIIRKEWTPEGKEYIENQLGGLTGFMRDRLLIGKWSLAEGLVYEEWREEIHLIDGWKDGKYIIQPDWPRYWAIDFGYTDPLTLQMWAKDGDGRAYLYREFYKTGQLVEDVAKWAWEEVKMGREPRPRQIVCDHDPENQMTFTKHCGGMAVELADKSDRKGGIQAMKARLKIQKDGRPRMYILKGCLTHKPDKSLEQKGKPISIVQELSGYCWNPDKDLPMDGDDHGCFVAGTMVSTSQGERPIESIKTGDLVWTREGLNRVLDCGMTSSNSPVITTQFSNGESLTSTANHPVFVNGKGFIRIDTASYGDIIVPIQEGRSWKSFRFQNQSELLGSDSTGKSIDDTLKPNHRRTGTISSAGLATGLKATVDCIKMFGSTITDLFLKEAKFTTKTKTASIIQSEIWNCLTFQSTKKSIAKNHPGVVRNDLGRLKKMAFMQKCLLKLLSGTEVKKEKNGTYSMQKTSSVISRRLLQNAASVVGSLKWLKACLQSQNFAVTPAQQSGEEGRGLITSLEHAKFAKGCLQSTNTQKSKHARVSVIRQWAEEREMPIYNLTVEGCPEYFVNGILVHNCDAARYACPMFDKSGGWGIR